MPCAAARAPEAASRHLTRVVVSSPRGAPTPEQLKSPAGRGEEGGRGRVDTVSIARYSLGSSAGVLVLATRVVDAYIMPLGGKALKKREQVRGPRPRPRGFRFRPRGANAKAFATLQAKDAAAGIIRDEGVLRKMRTAKADVMCTICALAASDGSIGRRVARDRRGRSSARVHAVDAP